VQHKIIDTKSFDNQLVYIKMMRFIES